MNRKILLAVLPAILVLSACQASPKVEANNLFLEDTLAHEEIFGNVELEARSLQPRRLDDPIEHPDTNNFSIGVQSQSENTGYISFRFVAAVRFADSELDPTQAVWSRTVSYTNGNVKKAFGTFPSANAYKKISNGGSAYSIDDYNGAHGLTGDNAYTHFVVYTLRNVPVDSNDYYVSTYLTLSTKEGESGGKELTSKAVAINASETAKFVYDLGNNGGMFFLEGIIGGSQKIVKATTIREGGNKASFENVNLVAGDSFVIKEFYNTELEVHGSSTFSGEVSTFNLNNNDAGGKIGVNYSGKYTFYFKYINGNNELWTNASKLVRPMYVKTEYVKGDWWSSTPKIRLWCVKSNNGSWVDLKTVTNKELYVTDGNFDPTVYDYVIVARTNGSNITEWWNQTINVGDLNRTDSDSNENAKVLNCIAVWTSKQGDHYEYGWEKATGNPID